jgi:hypothetical protein
MLSEEALSKEYHQVKEILLGGWKGEFNELATSIGRPKKTGSITAKKLVTSFSRRHPSWPTSNVWCKA